MKKQAEKFRRVARLFSGLNRRHCNHLEAPHLIFPCPVSLSRGMGHFYEGLVRPFLFRLDTEHAHEIAVDGLALLGRLGPLCRVMESFTGLPREYRERPVECLGLKFPNRVGLAAGFDKNARAWPAAGAWSAPAARPPPAAAAPSGGRRSELSDRQVHHLRARGGSPGGTQCRFRAFSDNCAAKGRCHSADICAAIPVQAQAKARVRCHLGFASHHNEARLCLWAFKNLRRY